MNYGPQLAVGCAELRAWAKEFTEEFHAPPGGWEQRDVLMTSGNTDGITKTVMLLTDPGDVILADCSTYPGIQASAVPLGRQVVGVKMDSGGMDPEALSALLSGSGVSGRARILYLTPHGQNPTSITLSDARKRALYEVAQRHRLTILEDDPYFFVNLQRKDASGPFEPENMLGTSSYPKSLLSIDVDGRVVRLDSCSKMLAPGFRLGWVCGHKTLLAKWAVLAEVLTWSVSGSQQSMLLSMLQEFGKGGLHTHLQTLQCTYAKRCNNLAAACRRHLEGLCHWEIPEFGMFLWLQVVGIKDASALVDDLIENHGVALVPGSAFNASEAEGASACFRASFSLLTEEMADKAVARLREALILAMSSHAVCGEKRKASPEASSQGSASCARLA